MEMEYEENYTINYDKEQYWGYYFTPDKYRILERCEGSWLKEIKFGDKVYWDIDKDIPNWIRQLIYGCPHYIKQKNGYLNTGIIFT